MPNSRVFLDIDLDSHRAKYRARRLRGGDGPAVRLHSKEIAELGGGEKQRVLECTRTTSTGPTRARSRSSRRRRRVVIELFDDKAPMAVENFKALSWARGVSKNCGVAYSTRASVSPGSGFMAQGGDFAMQNGGASIWGKKFKDEKDGLRLKHDARGCPWGTRGRTPTVAVLHHIRAAQLDGLRRVRPVVDGLGCWTRWRRSR